MTLTIFDPLTGKRVTITIPEEPSPQTQPRATRCGSVEAKELSLFAGPG